MIIDLIVLGIILLSIFVGYKQGLIKSVVKLVAFAVAIIVAITLYKPISKVIINKTEIDDKINNAIIEKVNPNDEEQTVEVKNIFQKTATTTVSEFAKVISVKIIEICVFIVLYIIAKFILRFITIIADLIARIPILKQFNKLGGIIYGFLKGILIVYVLLGIIYIVSPLIDEKITNNINNTKLTKILYNNNLITNIIL